MKRFLTIIFFIFITLLVFSKKIDYENTAEYIIEVENETKDRIFMYLKTWILKNFNWKNENLEKTKSSGTWVTSFSGTSSWKTTTKEPNSYEIVEDNKDLGRIKFYCYNQIIREEIKGYAYKTVSFTCQVDVKDGKYKVLFSDIIIKDWRISGNAQNTFEIVEKKVTKELNDLMIKYIENSASDLKLIIENEKASNW